jgi:translation initiation factor 2 subunit 2
MDDCNDNDKNELYEMFDLSKKKKKHKKKIVDETIETIETIETNEKNIKEELYNYFLLLNRLYLNIECKKEYKENTTRVKGPTIVKISSRKIAWTNFFQVCESLKREETYLYKYVLTELNTTGSIDGNKYFIIKGNHNQKVIENILKKYIVNYIQCVNCLCLNTSIKKDLGRIYIITCNMCKSTKNILI